MNALEFDQVSFGYDGRLIFDKTSFSVPVGEFLVLIGPNGGGKSTLLKLSLGLLSSSQGYITVLGETPGRSRSVGYVPQDVGQGISMPVTVERVVSMGTIGSPSSGNESVDQAIEAMNLDDVRKKSIKELSQGQRQRALIARALAGDPNLLLLDEPFASVDPDSRQSVFKCLKEAARSKTVVVVSHDYSIIPTCATAVACVDRGVFYHGKGELTEELFQRASCSCPVEVIGHGLPHRVLGEHP